MKAVLIENSYLRSYIGAEQIPRNNNDIQFYNTGPRESGKTREDRRFSFVFSDLTPTSPRVRAHNVIISLICADDRVHRIRPERQVVQIYRNNVRTYITYLSTTPVMMLLLIYVRWDSRKRIDTTMYYGTAGGVDRIF